MDFQTINPATGAIIRDWTRMDRDETFAIARAAHEAYGSWRRLSPAERAPHFERLAEVLEANRDRWAGLITDEMGKTITESRAEIEKCAWLSRFYAEKAPGWLEDRPVTADGVRHLVAFEPLGVILAVMPWNYPFWQALRFAVPGLIAGNTGLLKHASNVTGCAFAIESAFREAGFPDDVFRTIVPDYDTVDALLASDLVQGASLTGSTAAGRTVGGGAGRNLKTCVLELGGSDPFIVLEDADIEFTARGAVSGRMMATGQSCIASKRFIVVESVAEAFTARFAVLMGELKLGNPHDASARVGAIVNEPAIEELLAQIKDSVDAGARVLCGGRRGPGPGFFLEPTVVSGVTPEMRLFREEVFGPVAPVIVVEDEREAVALANDSEFGLGGSVWTRDLERGVRIAREIESGTLFVNSFTKSDPRMPFGGVKLSGLGRELSEYGLKEFVNIKGINVYAHGD